ncbi:hypothetical protein [Streptomyces sp. NBC_00342]|uniref:hypothetical protein n=1 Tax=Streptomyces sp. NBC_00342 TaxID=2975718 RepID=UPI002E2C92CB|nr:hypothetical protein [Streptomyces sp. NBC_00342]
MYALANELLAQVGLPGLQWYPPDGRPSTTVLAVCLLACPGLAWFVGRHRADEAALRPLQVRRASQPRPPKKHGMLLLLPGLGIICGRCALGALGRDTSDGPANSVLVPVGVLLSGVAPPHPASLPWSPILLIAALASRPLTHRHVELEHIRRD